MRLRVGAPDAQLSSGDRSSSKSSATRSSFPPATMRWTSIARPIAWRLGRPLGIMR